MAKKDRSVLLPPYMEGVPFWEDMIKFIDNVFEGEVDDPTRWLAKLRHLWILTTDAIEKVERAEMLSVTDWEMPEREILVKQAKQLGFDFVQTDLISEDDYQRIVRNIALYWYSKGKPNFIDFLGFVIEGVIRVNNLWSTTSDQASWDTYGSFLPEGDEGIGTPVWLTERFGANRVASPPDTNLLQWQLDDMTRIGVTTGPSGALDAVTYQAANSNPRSVFQQINAGLLPANRLMRFKVSAKLISGAAPTTGEILRAEVPIGATSALTTYSINASGSGLDNTWKDFEVSFVLGTGVSLVDAKFHLGLNQATGRQVAYANPELYEYREGTWFPTTHVQVVFDPFKFDAPKHSKLVNLFYTIANYNLVLESVIMEGDLYIHSVDDPEIAYIVVTYPITHKIMTIETL